MPQSAKPTSSQPRLPLGAVCLRLALIAAALLLTSFAASNMVTGHWWAFDTYLLEGMRTPGQLADLRGSRAVEIAVRDLSGLGGVFFLSFITAAAAGYVWLQGGRRAAASIVLIVASGVIVSETLKHLVGRARPDIVPHAVNEVSASFPSGHAMMATIVYLTLGGIIASLQTKTSARHYILALAIALPVAVGFSRVYLGVHWPSDVMGGWMFGALWVALSAYFLEAQTRIAASTQQNRPDTAQVKPGRQKR